MKNVTVCTFKTSPCVPAPRAHMLKHVCAWCRYTRGRFERTHGDVLSGHTEFRSVSHTNTHTLRPQHHTTDRDRDRQRQRQTETETDRDRDRQRQRQTETETDRDRDRQRQREQRRESVVVRGLFFC